jgi:hypothetical protein
VSGLFTILFHFLLLLLYRLYQVVPPVDLQYTPTHAYAYFSLLYITPHNADKVHVPKARAVPVYGV